VNASQSTNDAYPTGFHIAVYNSVIKLLEKVAYLQQGFENKAKECEKVAQMLDDGGLLLAQLVQLVGHQTLTTEQKTVLANFKAVKNYLTGNFRTTAKHVKAVEDGTATKCYRERFIKDEVKQNDK